MGLKLNGTHQLLAYADDVNLLGDNINIVKKNTGTSTDAGKEVGWKINIEKTKYMLLSDHQTAGQNNDINIANGSSEIVALFIHFGMTVTNQNLIQEEIKRRLNLDSACYHSVQGLLSSCLLSKNVKIRIYIIILLPVVFCGCA
jgi:hypothetical protein